MRIILLLFLSVSVLSISGCVIDEAAYDHGYYSSGSQHYVTPPQYYPDPVTSGYNRDYSTSQRQTITQDTTSSQSQASSHVNNGYSSK